MRNKKTIITFILCTLILTMPFFAVATKKIAAVNSLIVFKRVVIDAGHGGADSGAVGSRTGVEEAKINLSIAKLLQAEFERHGYVVIMTRVDENGLYGQKSEGFKLRDLKNRVEIINSAKPDVVISIHINKYSLSSRRGAQVFFNANSSDSEFLARSVQNHLNLMPEAKRTYRELAGDYYILRESEFPAIITECGFLSNPEEEMLLQDEVYQKAIANAIFNGANAYVEFASI